MLYLSQCVNAVLDHETHQAFCQKALARNRHIEKLINDMLVFAHGGQFVTTRFTVADLCSELNEQLMPQLQQRAATLHMQGQDSAVELQGNQDALLGALANLCMNALQAFSTKTDGTGLGLAVVKAVVESHQGRIAVFSRPGRGCRFRIFLPCRQAMKTQISKT
jgi:two-component system sensor histidine kinase FlrB